MIHAWHRKAAVLLGGRRKNDISDDIKGHIQGLWLVIPDVSHFEAAGENFLYVKEAAVHGISSGRHVMYIDIAVPAGLDFLSGHKELLIQLLVELIEDKASLGGYKGGIRIGIFLVSDIHDGLALFVYIVHHPDKILLVIAVIPVRFGNDGLDLFKHAFHYVMHQRDGHLVHIQLIHPLYHLLADKVFFFLRKFSKRSIGRFPHRIYDLLDIKLLSGPVLLDHPDILLRFVQFGEIYRLLRIRFRICHFPLLFLEIAVHGRSDHDSLYLFVMS